MTGDSSSALQQQVPLVSGSAPPGYTGLLQESTASALDLSLCTSQPSHDIQYKPGFSPGTVSDAICVHWGE